MSAIVALAACLAALQAEPAASPPSTSTADLTSTPTATPTSDPDPTPTSDPTPIPTSLDLPPTSPPTNAPSPSPFRPDVALAYGRHVTRLMGVTATGSQFLLSSSTRPPVVLPSARARIALDVFVGRTDAGLAVRSASLAAELWTAPARRLRGGLGLELGVVGYVRATDGSLSGLLTAGARAAVEVAALRLRWGEVIAGGEAAARVGPWASAGLFAGVRLGRPSAHAAR